MIPIIINVSKGGKESIDLLSYEFTTHRKIWLTGEITDTTATEIITQLEYLDELGHDDITIYINSPGGSITAGLAIADAMARVKSDVSTVCTGIAASMGALLLTCGEKGKRYATPMSEIMLHQPLGGTNGQASDIELAALRILRIKNQVNELLAANTGKPVSQIAKDCDRDFFLTAQQAIDYGAIDCILS